MKKSITLLLLLPFVVVAQIPSYYNDIDITLKGNTLKSTLSKKINDTHHNLLSYSNLWDVLKKTDLDPKNPENVVLIYGWDDNDNNYESDRTRNKEKHGSITGSDWNREHIFPRSLGTPELGYTLAGSDAHNIKPCDVIKNTTRNNRKFNDGTGIESYITTNSSWYPGNEWKGDIARIIMYLYLRYPEQCLPINVGIGNPITTDTKMIDLFLKWNVEDPVSKLEKQRNLIIENLQGNRNPFIDNPAFATMIWGGDQAEDKFNGYINGKDNNGKTTDLLISEYVEGFLYNKAIEIANFTGKTIDLSEYSLKKASNGNGTFKDELKLDGTLENNSVYVITNSASSENIINKSNLLTKSYVMAFNGNDAIGLFHNNQLIDLIGTPDNSTYYAKNKTLQRKPSIKSPNTVYTISEWYSLGNENISGLQFHHVDKETTLSYTDGKILKNANEKDDVIIYPNPIKNKINIKLNKYYNTSYKIYDVTGKVLQKGKIQKSIPITLPSGIYFIKIKMNKKLFVKKLFKL